jgi:hypothetical protein
MSVMRSGNDIFNRIFLTNAKALTNDQCVFLLQWSLQTADILNFGMIYAAKRRFNSWANLKFLDNGK